MPNGWAAFTSLGNAVDSVQRDRAQAYTANNDLLPNPFPIGSLNFSNSGTGAITVTGNALSGNTLFTNSTGTGNSVINNGGFFIPRSAFRRDRWF